MFEVSVMVLTLPLPPVYSCSVRFQVQLRGALPTNACPNYLAAFLLWFIRVNNKKREAGQYDHYLDSVTPEEAYKLGNNHPGFRYKP